MRLNDLHWARNQRGVRFMKYQHTLAGSATFSGLGLHSGVPVNIRLLPAPANHGIIFKRVDLEGFRVEALARNVARVSYATSLMKKGVLISTTEHLLSAFMGCGVDNVVVEIDSLETPIGDGSALPFVRLIEAVGRKRQRGRRSYLQVLRPVEVVDGKRHVAIYPSDTYQISCLIEFVHPLIGLQRLEFGLDSLAYRGKIAPARTFGFHSEVEGLRKSGLVRGGSLENAIVLTADGFLNPEGLRFADEFCRHKILDLIGDLALLGAPLLGHVVVERGGHALHYALVSKLLKDKSLTRLVTAEGLHPTPPRSMYNGRTPTKRGAEILPALSVPNPAPSSPGPS